jgi:hypothetical protein
METPSAPAAAEAVTPMKTSMTEMKTGALLQRPGFSALDV